MKTEKKQSLREVGGEPWQGRIMRPKVGFQKVEVVNTDGVEKSSNQRKIANVPVASALTVDHAVSVVAEAWQLWFEK